MTHEAIGSAYETLLTKENKQSFLTAFSFHCGLFPLVSNATNVALSDLIDQHFSISTLETANQLWFDTSGAQALVARTTPLFLAFCLQIYFQ